MIHIVANCCLGIPLDYMKRMREVAFVVAQLSRCHAPDIDFLRLKTTKSFARGK